MSRLNIAYELAAAFVVTIAFPGLSAAQTCTSTTDCTKGLTCQVSAVPPAGTVAPTCPKGVVCDVAIIAPTSVQNNMTCQPAPCQSDGDCAMGMLCHTETISSCTGGGARACAANTICDPVNIPPPVCTETKVSACVFTWQLPCMADLDCGADFVCNPITVGICSGGTGVATGGGTSSPTTVTGGSSGSSPVADPAPPLLPRPSADAGTGAVDGGMTCTTSTSYPGYCSPKATTCVADSDCPAAWTCVAAPGPLTGGSTPVDTTAKGVAVTTTGLPLPPDQPVVVTKLCQPPPQFPVRGTAFDATGSGSQLPTSAGGNGGAGGNGANGGKGTAPPEAVSTSSSGSGCAVAGTATSSSEIAVLTSSLLGLLLTALTGLRRGATRKAD